MLPLRPKDDQLARPKPGGWHPPKQVQASKLIWVFPKIGIPPKSSILIGFSIINHPFWGTPIFGSVHIWQQKSSESMLPGHYQTLLSAHSCTTGPPRQVTYEPMIVWLSLISLTHGPPHMTPNAILKITVWLVSLQVSVDSSISQWTNSTSFHGIVELDLFHETSWNMCLAVGMDGSCRQHLVVKSSAAAEATQCSR